MWVEEKKGTGHASGWNTIVPSKDYKKAQALVDYVGLILQRMISEDGIILYSGSLKDDDVDDHDHMLPKRMQVNNSGSIVMNREAFFLLRDFMKEHLPNFAPNLRYAKVYPFNYKNFVKALTVLLDHVDPEKIPDGLEIFGENRVLIPNAASLRKLASLRPLPDRCTEVESGFLGR